MARKRRKKKSSEGGFGDFLLLAGIVFFICYVSIKLKISFWAALILVFAAGPLLVLTVKLIKLIAKRRKSEGLQAAAIECLVSAAGIFSIIAAASDHPISILWLFVLAFCVGVFVPRLFKIFKWALTGGVNLEVSQQDPIKETQTEPAQIAPTVTTPLPASETPPTPAPITPPVQIKRRIPVPNVGTITIGINRPMSEQRGGMGRRLNEYVRDCVVLAITATGYGPQTGEMVELAAIKLRNLETVDTFCQLIKPRNKLTAEETANTGITNLMLSKAPGMDATLTAFAGFVGDDPIVGFETQRNLFFIYDALIAHTDIVFSNDYLDLQRMAWKTLPDIEPDHLSDIYVRLGCPQVDSTRTMGRCETIMQCYKLMASMAADARIETLPTPEEAKVTEETEATEAPQSAEELHPTEGLPPDAESTPAEAPQPVKVEDLLVSVIDWVLTEKRPTVPAIQKEFGISRGKAKQIMAEMELLGVVGPAQSSKPREVLVESNPLGN